MTEAGREWSVWRRDDHGHEFEVSRGHDEASARRRADELEARGHRQTYWAQPVEPAGATPPAGGRRGPRSAP